jgi:DNA polymerase-4
VTDLVEPLALDEAFLDVSVNKRGEPLAGRVAQYVKARIREVTGLAASAGVGPNKLVAKLASAHDKPDGLCIVPPDRVLAFLAPLPVDRMWGVGPVTAARLEAAGLKTVADLRAQTPAALSLLVGRWGETLWRQAHGDDDRPVVTDREPRSRGAETTLERDTRALEVLGPLIVEQASEVADALTRNARRARTITLKIRFSDFVTRTRARSLSEPVGEAAVLASVGEALLREVLDSDPRDVRLIGLQASQLVDPSTDRQLAFDFP